jgi:hypothetical protein
MSGSEIDIKSVLRNGASKDDLTKVFRSAVLAKPIGNHSNRGRLKSGMNQIGG